MQFDTINTLQSAVVTMASAFTTEYRVPFNSNGLSFNNTLAGAIIFLSGNVTAAISFDASGVTSISMSS
jgi:hypothetical protein